MKILGAITTVVISLTLGGSVPKPTPSPPSTVVSTPSLSYRYYGAQIGKLKYVVQLNSATITAGHAAIWGGVQNANATRWVQAGVEDQDATGPHLYIETRNGSWSNYSIRLWPASFGERVVVKLIRVNNRWHVTIAGKRSRGLYFSRPIRLGTLEIMNQATAIAHLNGHKIIS